MRIDAADPKRPDESRSKDTFKKALEKAQPKGKPSKPVAGLRPFGSGRAAMGVHPALAESQALGAKMAEGLRRDVKGQSVLSSARGEAEATSQSRANARSQGIANQEQKAKDRIGELLARELGQRPDAPPPASQRPAPSKPEKDANTATGTQAAQREQPPAAPPVSATQEASSVMAMVEKVELFVRSNRPTLSLSLGGELAGQMEIEKTGPGQIALTLRGGKQDAQAPERIREALARRGLTVTRLRMV